MVERRVVVTGRAAISPLGLTPEQTFQSLVDGKSGIRRISHEEQNGEEIERVGKIHSQVDLAALVPDEFDPTRYIPKKNLFRAHRAAQFSVTATGDALKDADLLDLLLLEQKKISLNTDSDRVGIIIGTGIGGASEIAEIEDILLEKGDKHVSSFAMLRLLPERSATIAAMIFGMKAFAFSIQAACASGSTAIDVGIDRLIRGKADIVVTGGTESAVHRVALAAFNAQTALSRKEDPNEACRPFDKGASGFIMSEGAGILVLEELNHALARKAPIYAEIIGYGESSDASHDTVPSGEGAVRAMRLALAEAELEPEDIDYINTHGTSTPIGDGKELWALKQVFGEKLAKIAVSSTKSATGHLLGAAGALEAVICLEAIRRQMVPPTLNLHNPIEEAEGLDLVPLQARKRKIITTMNNSLGFGGINTIGIFRKYAA